MLEEFLRRNSPVMYVGPSERKLGLFPSKVYAGRLEDYRELKKILEEIPAIKKFFVAPGKIDETRKLITTRGTVLFALYDNVSAKLESLVKKLEL